MSVTYGFYNAVNHDRQYDAEQLSSIFDGVIADGIYATIGEAFAVKIKTDADLQCTVGTGRAWFNHTWTYNDAAIVVDFATPNVLYPRIDVVYIEVDTNNRTNAIKVYTGTPASTPTVPTLPTEDGVYRYPLANVQIENVTSTTYNHIVPTKVTSVIGTNTCPFVTGILETIDITELMYDWTIQMEELLAELRAAISTAGSAQLIDGAVTTAKLADGAVTTAKLDTPYVPIAGGTMSGQLILGGGLKVQSSMYLGSDVYGDNLPASGTVNQVFFKKVT